MQKSYLAIFLFLGSLCFPAYALSASETDSYRQEIVSSYRFAARNDEPGSRATSRSKAKNLRSMSEAIAIAKSRVPGEVVSAKKRVSNKGGLEYRIKILSRKGVVRTVRVDGRR